MKKAQITGQIFIYIMAALIFGLVLLYGYSAIGDFLKRTNQVSEIELATDLKSSIKSIASSQDVKQKSISVPSRFKEICFIDLNKQRFDIGNTEPELCKPTKDDGSVNEEYNLLICNFWKSETQQNVFLLPGADIKMYVGEIEVYKGPTTPYPGYNCTSIVGGKVKLRLEGKGDKTYVSEWPQT
jgi:hypothetical protein